jgi:hypothetical protein
MNNYERTNIDKKNNELVRASSDGYISDVERLLQDPRVDPSYNDNCAIQAASIKSHLAVVERLLQDPRVDPSANYNRAMQWASFSGCLEVVERLLQDPRVDPSARNNIALQVAASNGCLAVVERLLQDPRVDVHKFDTNKICFLPIKTIIALNLELPFPADSSIKHLESDVREQRQEFIDIIAERTVYNNTDTSGIHREVWKYVVSTYLK